MAHLIYLNSYEMNLSDLSHSQICQRVRSVICEAVWEAVRVRSVRPWESLRTLRQITWFESPIGLSRTPGDAVILGPVWLISRLNALHRPESDRPLTHTGRESDRPHRFESPIGLSRTPGDAVILGPVWLISRLNALPWPLERVRDLRGRVRERPIFGLSIWEAVCVRGRAPLIGSDRSHDKSCEAVRLWGRFSDSQIWEADLWGRSVRPWEAVRGRAPLIGLEICVRESQIYWSQSGEHGLSRTRPLR